MSALPVDAAVPVLKASALKHTTEQAIHLPVGLLAASPTNPRKRFSQDKIDELAASIKKHGGVIQPILARPNPQHSDGNGQPPYEIVAGERRWRASKQAGMPTLLALVRDLSDFDALELQFLENIEREDLHPLEEADGLHKLLRNPSAGSGLQGYATAEDLAERIGKSRRWVYKRLTLLNLCDSARDAFLADSLNASLAYLIARMPDQAQQATATTRILQGFNGEPFTVRAAEAFLHKEFMLDLAKAPFDVIAIYQVAGPCGQCPKRSGAAPELFDDVKAGDMCQDSNCFNAKGEEAHQALLQAARDAGHTVLSGAAARELMYNPGVLPSGYHWLDKPCPALTDDKRPLREIFGAKQRDAITVDHPASSVALALIPDASAKKLLKSKSLLRPEPPKAPTPVLSAAASDASRPNAPTPVKATPLNPTQLNAAIDKRSGQLFSEMLAHRLNQHVEQAGEPPLLALRLAILELLEEASANACELVFSAMGWPAPVYDAGYRRSLRERLGSLGGPELGRMLEHVLYAEAVTEKDSLEDMRSYNSDNNALELAAHYEIDVDALQAEADEGAKVQVRNEEARRLGLPVPDGPSDATAAFVAHKTSPAAKSVNTVKYRNLATGETWSGRGLQPKWLKVAIANGAKLQDLEVTA